MAVKSVQFIVKKDGVEVFSMTENLEEENATDLMMLAQQFLVDHKADTNADSADE